MAIASISLNFTRPPRHGAAAAPNTAAAPAGPAPTDTFQTAQGWVGARRNALVDAMMSALQAKGLQAATAATPPAADAAVNPNGAAAATEPAPAAATEPASIDDAVLQFASALWQALGAASAAGTDSELRGNGERVGYARHHHPHHGRGEQRSYAGLVQRLDALAASFGSTVPATETATGPATDSAPAPTTTPAPVDATPPTPLPVADGSTAAPARSPNPLADAFAGLLAALQPSATVPASTGDIGTQLATFLRSLSQALSPAGAAAASWGLGAMIDVSA